MRRTLNGFSSRATVYDSNVQQMDAQAQLAIAKAIIEGLLLTGGLDAVCDGSLRGQPLRQH